MYQPTIEKLQALRLGAMADALSAQLRQPEIDALPFAERLALLVDVQHSATLNAALEQRLRRAGMRQPACMENIDLRTPRGLDRASIHALANGAWLRQHRNVATRRRVTATRCSTNACRACSTNWRWRGCMAARPAC